MTAQEAILLSGGYSHPFDESSPALAKLIEAAGWRARIEQDIDCTITALADRPGLLAVNALMWSMTQHEKYAPDRDRYAFFLPDSHMDAIQNYVAGGGRLFVLHVSTICWDTQPRWHDVMGGGWTWGHSHHPPFGEITVKLTQDGRGLSNGADTFMLLDEAYHNLDPAADCEVLATSEIDAGPQPVAWIRRYGEGRVAVDALGHDARSINAPGHRELIAAQLAWLAR
jgi:uncharacterized protein